MNKTEREIRSEIYKLLASLHADTNILGLIGSWSEDMIDDKVVLDVLQQNREGTLKENTTILDANYSRKWMN